MIASPKIVAKNISVHVDQLCLLNDFDITIEAGTWLGIVGPNGGGKSTFLKALAGLMPHRGEIALHWPNAKEIEVGYMPQLAPFEASLPITVNDFFRMHCERRPIWQRYKANPSIEDCIKLLEIEELRNNRIGTLSMGERQRVLLGCALANKPQILLLDEPLAGIDKAGQEKILSVLQDYNRNGGSILMIEHNWQVIQQNCTHVAWIDAGLKQFAEPSEVFAQIQQQASPFEFAEMA